MIGIYKVTNPNGRVYIGQSIDIENRFKQYTQFNCKKQKVLYRSLLKYGIKAHKFEIITRCYEEQLNEFERDFQEAYDVIGKNGLNCKLVHTNDRTGVLSNKTKNKISNTLKNVKRGNYSTNRKLFFYPPFIYKYRNNIIGPCIKRKKAIYKNELKQHVEHINKICVNKNKFILDTNTGIFYYSSKEISVLYNIKNSTLMGYLRGHSPNKTQFIYV